MHFNMLTRKRFLIYVQIAVFFLGAIYLLSSHDKLPQSTSWGIPDKSVDPAPIEADGAKPPSAEAAAPGYKVADLPPTAPEPDLPDNGDSLYKPRPSSKGVWREDEDEPEKTQSSDKAHNATQELDGGRQPEGDETAGEVDESDGKVGEVDDGNSKETGVAATATQPGEEPSPSPTPLPPPPPTKDDLISKARGFIPSILDPNDTSIDRMFCPAINSTRYSYLKASRWERKPKYFFAVNLRQCVDLLPRLLGSLFEAIDFLGPEQCAVSIVEGNSDDGTLEVLELLEREFGHVGTPYYLRSTPVNPSDGDRIKKLAMLRSMALTPISGTYVPVDEPIVRRPVASPASGTRSPQPAQPRAALPTPSSVPRRLQLAEDATVVFLNDVAACAEDMLELVHQRAAQGADMTCAMDWTHPGPEAIFYDVWISRALNGDIFFDIPNGTGSWDNATHLFWNEPVARARLAAHRPFQVFACWNGAVAFTAAPVVRGEVAFRSSRPHECFQGEPQLFCKDMWFKGYGKIAVVPSVNLQYTDELGRRVKKQKGYVAELIADEAEAKNGTALLVPWKLDPPELVKCMPDFKDQTWLPWNESLPLE